MPTAHDAERVVRALEANERALRAIERAVVRIGLMMAEVRATELGKTPRAYLSELLEQTAPEPEER